MSRPEITPCPPGCIEHYEAGDGTWNHATAPRWVTGESATREAHVVSVSTWLEQRHGTDGEVRAVGIIEKKESDDVELSAAQLRELARHMVAVADQVEAATAAIQRPAVVPATSEFVGRTNLEVRSSRIGGRSVHLHTGVSGEDLMLDPASARRLATALAEAAGAGQ